MDIGIVILIILSNLACFALGAYAYHLGVNTSFLDAKGFPLPTIKRKPKNNTGTTEEEAGAAISQMYEDS